MCSLFLLFFALLIFLFSSAILASMHLFLDGGCHLRDVSLIGSLGTLSSKDLRDCSDFLSFSAILSASLFMDLIFFLLNLALVLLDAFTILSSSSSIWNFKLSFSFPKFLNFLASLESLFHLHLSCLLVRASNSGCLTSFSRSRSGSQVDICEGRFGSQVDICGGQFGSQVDICGVGAACLCGGLCCLL